MESKKVSIAARSIRTGADEPRESLAIGEVGYRRHLGFIFKASESSLRHATSSPAILKPGSTARPARPARTP